MTSETHVIDLNSLRFIGCHEDLPTDSISIGK